MIQSGVNSSELILYSCRGKPRGFIELIGLQDSNKIVHAARP